MSWIPSIAAAAGSIPYENTETPRKKKNSVITIISAVLLMLGLIILLLVVPSNLKPNEIIFTAFLLGLLLGSISLLVLRKKDHPSSHLKNDLEQINSCPECHSLQEDIPTNFCWNCGARL